MSTAHFLIEIGTEELPPKALLSLSTALEKAVLAGLKQQHLAHEKVERFATPRRLALRINSLQLQASDQDIEIFGPPADKARDADGSWSPAAQGFARKNRVEPEELETAQTDKGPRLVYRSSVPGLKAEACLPAIVEAAVQDLPVPKRMRWGSGRTEFVRPVHWIVMLLGDKVVDGEILGQRAGRHTQGHRFHSSGDLLIEEIDDYADVLRRAYVIADFDERRELIRTQVEDQAQAISATAIIDDALLDEVTALVEWPVALTGSFEERFLDVPPEALVSSMKEHQKYFHLVDGQGNLLPNFITVANIASVDPAQVIEGNERVIRPRLSDANFFFNTDKKTALAARVEALGKIVFQQKLGTLLDKTNRLVSLAGKLGSAIGADEDHCRRAALLSKTDLLTDMVGEFADMQGIAGRYYAIHDGEPDNVAAALQQHYWPRFAGDALPANLVSTTLALADRLDTLVGIFGIGQAPTGSRDPFALRRASLGVLRIMVEGELDLDLLECLALAFQQYPADSLHPDTVAQVNSYMLERFRAWYEDENIAVEVFKSVSARHLSHPLDIHRRVHAVNAFSRMPEAASLATANKRVSNILDKQGFEIDTSGVSEHLLQDAAEQQLAQALQEKAGQVDSILAAGDYTQALASLAELQQPVDAFFDQVMVMADDPDLRANRLRLLSSLQDLFLKVADISQLVVSR